MTREEFIEFYTRLSRPTATYIGAGAVGAAAAQGNEAGIYAAAALAGAYMAARSFDKKTEAVADTANKKIDAEAGAA